MGYYTHAPVPYSPPRTVVDKQATRLVLEKNLLQKICIIQSLYNTDYNLQTTGLNEIFLTVNKQKW